MKRAPPKAAAATPAPARAWLRENLAAGSRRDSPPDDVRRAVDQASSLPVVTAPFLDPQPRGLSYRRPSVRNICLKPSLRVPGALDSLVCRPASGLRSSCLAAATAAMGGLCGERVVHCAAVPDRGRREPYPCGRTEER
jgi:hypothetical protein